MKKKWRAENGRKRLIETVRSRGLSLRLDGDRIKVEAPQEPDPETKALVDELRQYREEVKIILASPFCWNCGAATTEVGKRTDMALLEVKRSPDGRRILARRKDRKPLTPEDREEAIKLIVMEELPRVWVVEEIRDGDSLKAVKIRSAFLEAHLWIVFDRGFIPHDGLAAYYAEEVLLFRGKSPEDLKEIHKVKLAFPGCRVIQEGPGIGRSAAA